MKKRMIKRGVEAVVRSRRRRSHSSDRSVVVEFSITPIGKEESVSSYVTRATRIVRRSGMPNELHAMGTIVEGTWDEVFDLIRRCHDELATDCRRISIAIKVDSRAGSIGRLKKKVDSVEKRLGR